jgi:hypothetical protein
LHHGTILYCDRFAALKEFGGYRLTILLLVSFAPTLLRATESRWVRTGASGRLIYVPDAEGDRILDFSNVGYRGRGVDLLPNNVANVITLAPIAGDDTAQIQAALNSVAAMPLGSDGFRGAVLLGPGHYDIATQLNITASGMVLRGVGRETNQTVLHARGTTQRSLLNIVGAGSPSFTGFTKRNMIDKVVPVGATSFRVDSTGGLAVGQTVRVERPSTASWIAAVGMDNPPDGDPPWQEGTMNIRSDRVITRIEGNRVFLDAPLATALELQYGGGTIQPYAWTGRIDRVGVENLRAESDYASDTDEAHAWEFVSIDNAQNVWVQGTTSQYFGDSSVVANPTAKWVTVANAINLDPKSIVTGERRYTYDLSGQLGFVTNSQANSGRHDFVNNSTRPAGPNVFHNSVANNALNDTGPHQRWASGTLFDNITVNGNNINVRNRGSLGTTHGWSGANMVIWNSTASGFIVQSPPTAQNWLIGSTGPIVTDTAFGPQPPGNVDSHGMPVTVGGTTSLYDAQTNDAADIRSFHWGGGSGNWTEHVAWKEGVQPGVYRVSTRDYLIGDIDGFTYDGPGSIDAAFIDPAWRTAIEASSALPITGFDNLAGNQNVAFTIQRQVAVGERVVHGYLALGMRQTPGGESATDFLRVFDMDPSHRIDFSAVGWNTQVTTTSTFVGVVDLGGFLTELQSSSTNVQLNDDAGLDWAMYLVAVATPIADTVGPHVFLDRGGSVTLSAPVSPVNSLQIGGAEAGSLRMSGGSTLDINSSFSQLANGTLTVELSSATPNGPLIEVTQNASLAGGLVIQLASGFAPALNSQFRILSASSGVQNDFDSLTLPTLASGLGWELSYNANSVDLKVVAKLPGDFNDDGFVDAADYTLWRDNLGSTTNLPNDSTPGTVTAADYDVWKNNFGSSLPTISTTIAVPEPASTWLLVVAGTWPVRFLRYASSKRRYVSKVVS